MKKIPKAFRTPPIISKKRSTSADYTSVGVKKFLVASLQLTDFYIKNDFNNPSEAVHFMIREKIGVFGG